MQHRSAYHSDDATWQARRRRDTTGGSAQTLTTLGGLGGCWCGLKLGHDWPTDQPHPRPADYDELTPKQKVVAAKLALQGAGVCPACCRGEHQAECNTCLTTGLFPRAAAEAEVDRRIKAKVAARWNE